MHSLWTIWDEEEEEEAGSRTVWLVGLSFIAITNRLTNQTGHVSIDHQHRLRRTALVHVCTPETLAYPHSLLVYIWFPWKAVYKDYFWNLVARVEDKLATDGTQRKQPKKNIVFSPWLAKKTYISPSFPDKVNTRGMLASIHFVFTTI